MKGIGPGGAYVRSILRTPDYFDLNNWSDGTKFGFLILIFIDIEACILNNEFNG